jgi:hypothetical protein
MEDMANVGLIKLIPKRVKRDLVGGWHPIIDLNFSYKILTKALARRIQLLLVHWIVHKEHIGFIKGRFIIDNLLTPWEGLEWA